ENIPSEISEGARWAFIPFEISKPGGNAGWSRERLQGGIVDLGLGVHITVGNEPGLCLLITILKR
ncbi:MAG: hypothetical protein ACRD3W_07080, partial [Terriglobales bacterium]